jgi:hypothetical protein
VAALQDACRRQPPLRPHPASNSLELPLTPLPAARRLARFYLLALGLYGGQLLLQGHWVMAAVMLLLAAVTRLAQGRMSPRGPGAARRLLLAGDGRLYVASVGGAVEPVELAGESLWLGSAVLLVLQAPGRRHRLLLGRGNLDPGQLAALRRRLRGAAKVAGDPAVDSEVNHLHRVSAIEQFTRGNPV